MSTVLSTDSTETWKVEPGRLGSLLKDLTLNVLRWRQEDVAERLGHSHVNTVSRWWQGTGLKGDQFAHLFGLMRESREARDRVLKFAGVEVPREVEDPELQHRIELVKSAYGKREDPVVRGLLNTLEAALQERPPSEREAAAS